MAEALGQGLTSFIGGAINEVAFEGPARRKHNAQMERLSEERFKREKVQIDKVNADREEQQAHTLGAMKGVAYRTAVAQLAASKREAQHFRLLSQDFLHQVGAKKALQSVEYAASGVVLKGSALVRLRETQQRGDVGAERLRKAANIALRRGSQRAEVTKAGVIAQKFVPLPDPIKQPTVPMRSSWSPLGSFWGGFSSGIQKDLSSGNWPFGGGGGSGGGGSFGGGGLPSFGSSNPWNSNPSAKWNIGYGY